jgi:hypothetical protein
MIAEEEENAVRARTNVNSGRMIVLRGTATADCEKFSYGPVSPNEGRNHKVEHERRI